MEYPLLNWSGKVGNYVICTYRGQKYVRRRPRKKCPPTPMQRAQRERISSIGILYKALKDAGLSPYWSTASEGQLAHGYNLVTRENLPAFCADGRICDPICSWNRKPTDPSGCNGRIIPVCREQRRTMSCVCS